MMGMCLCECLLAHTDAISSGLPDQLISTCNPCAVLLSGALDFQLSSTSARILAVGLSPCGPLPPDQDFNIFTVFFHLELNFVNLISSVLSFAFNMAAMDLLGLGCDNWQCTDEPD